MFGRRLVFNNLKKLHRIPGSLNGRPALVSAFSDVASSMENKEDLKYTDLSNPKTQQFLQSIQQEYYSLRVSPSANDFGQARLRQLDGVVQLYEKIGLLKKNLISLDQIEKEEDKDMQELMEEENETYLRLLEKTETQLFDQMMSLAADEYYPSLMFDINAGVGGQEAMLFANELCDMYINFFELNGWDYEILERDLTDIGGIRNAYIVVRDPMAYNMLRYEAGVHRVQRVPTTEKSGRIHTSTASVTVIPCPPDVSVNIDPKELKIETKRASGAGGQHVNTTDSAVRIVHLPTGTAIECQSERSQIKNREIAMKRLKDKLLYKKLEQVEKTKEATRKSQQGTQNRNEKIRTYNYVQDRITDHRIKDGTTHNLKEFLEGGPHLDRLIKRVRNELQKEILARTIDNWCLEQEKKSKTEKAKQ